MDLVSVKHDVNSDGQPKAKSSFQRLTTYFMQQTNNIILSNKFSSHSTKSYIGLNYQ